MGAAVGVREDFGAAELRRLAARAKDVAQARRLLALAAVCDGMNRTEAARIGGMDRQTLRDWVHRFNQYGPDGLIDIKPTGRPPKLSDEQKQALKQLVEAGPDLETDGVVRWRCVDLKRVLGQRFGVDLSEVSLGRVLKKLGFSHISARPRHPVQDPEAIVAFKKTFPRRSRSGSRTRCGSARRTASSTNGPRRDRGRASPRISATKTPMCSAPSVRAATPASPSSCRKPTLRPCRHISTRLAAASL